MKNQFDSMYHEIQFIETPDFKHLFEIAKEFYVQKDLSAPGCYSIVPELSGNGKINYVFLGKGRIN
ncbi:MAG: hypothetical protein IT410_04295 [Candidatus Doudnabacteria bacterium]|nr:hypothetical protein [Candidatus Doudnabacteria bacterium]